jgi:flagellin FlaB
MFGTNNEIQERGQVGIGTLIVFIALVLVAAIAAGVLINTAGFLQSQAEATGEESTDQVSNGLNVVSSTATVGTDGSGNEQISNVTIKVALAAGSDPINVTESNIQWIGDDNAVTADIQYVDTYSTSDTAGNNFFVDNATSDPELTQQGDTATIVIQEGGSAYTGGANEVTIDNNLLGSDLPMTSSEEATVTITTRSGSQTVTVLDAPNILEEGQGVSL